VRDPRPGLAWSGERLAIRARYSTYMDSPAWYQRRRAWLDSWTARTGRPPTCVVCDQPWTLRAGELHHRTYARLGHEDDRDLVPVCKHCHTVIHALLERSPSWRRLDRAQATDLIVARLHRRTGADGG
jgi:5-methylcytosine-specific restriction endonuclease McrA